MKVNLIALGGQGDVRPYMALGARLRQLGHTVKIATHSEFAEHVREIGLDFIEIGGSPRAMLESEAGQRWLNSGSNVFAHVRLSAEAVRPLLDDRTRDITKACLGTEAIIYSPLAYLAAHIAERMGIPCFAGDGIPQYRTRYHASPFCWAGRSLSWPINWLSHVLIDQYSWQRIRRPVNQWRKEALDLPPIGLLGPAFLRDRPTPLILNFSSLISPVPPDWPAWHHVTGTWFLDPPADYQPPQDVLDFLAAGPPPVAVGFGSMIARDAERLTDIVVKALRLAGKRGIIQSGWSGLGERIDGKDVLAVRSAEHSWLFPRVAAVIHHGGSGTTASGIRAGVPSIVTPFFADQPYWARRVYELGVGPAPVPHKKLTAERLAAAIRRATEDEGIRARAAALGAAMRAEDGVGRAAAVFESYVENWSGAPVGSAV
jgi:UDP:flavonoid glycosyltransferase YjiC (YdhE family)